MNHLINNNQGITAEQARFFKLGIDLDNNHSPFEKKLAKVLISSMVADPYDRTTVLRCDWNRCLLEIALRLARRF